MANNVDEIFAGNLPGSSNQDGVWKGIKTFPNGSLKMGLDFDGHGARGNMVTHIATSIMGSYLDEIGPEFIDMTSMERQAFLQQITNQAHDAIFASINTMAGGSTMAGAIQITYPDGRKMLVSFNLGDTQIGVISPDTFTPVYQEHSASSLEEFTRISKLPEETRGKLVYNQKRVHNKYKNGMPVFQPDGTKTPIPVIKVTLPNGSIGEQPVVPNGNYCNVDFEFGTYLVFSRPYDFSDSMCCANTRGLGDILHHNHGVVHEIYYTETELKETDLFVILFTDGVGDVNKNKEIGNHFMQLHTGKTLAEAGQALLEDARGKWTSLFGCKPGEGDDTSCVVWHI